MQQEHRVTTGWGTVVEDPPAARLLFNDNRFATVWLVVRVLLILAWKTAGWYGLDRFLLPRLGTPWSVRPQREPVPVMRREQRLDAPEL